MSLMVQADDTPGKLADVVRVLRDGGVNMTRLETRPSKFCREGRKVDFYVDFEVGRVGARGGADVRA